MPLRTCIGCRQKFEQADLIRVACLSGGKIEIALGRRLGGRGAYVCSSYGCIEAAIGRFGRALRTQAPDEEAIRRRLTSLVAETEIGEAAGNGSTEEEIG